MSHSRTIPVIIVNASPDYALALLPLGAAFLVLAFLFHRTLPTWARWALLTAGAGLIVGGHSQSLCYF